MLEKKGKLKNGFVILESKYISIKDNIMSLYKKKELSPLSYLCMKAWDDNTLFNLVIIDCLKENNLLENNETLNDDVKNVIQSTIFFDFETDLLLIRWDPITFDLS